MVIAEIAISETEDLIIKALKKIRGLKEKDICKYLPSETEGYMHHFTMRKIKKNKPEELRALIQEFILLPPSPRLIDPKPRTRRNKMLSLNQVELKLILNLAKKSGEDYLLSKLGAKLSLPTVKKELINSIKENRVEQELWCAFVQALETQPN